MSRDTVDTVLRRYGALFEPVGRANRTGPGRPPILWALKAEAIDDLVAEVESMQAAFGRPAPGEHDSLGAQDHNVTDASLALAADSVTRASKDSGDESRSFLAAARASLAAAGFDTERADLVASRGESSQTWRAGFIASTADLVEATLTGHQESIDSAYATALALATPAQADMPAAEWVGLTNAVLRAGTVLAAPIIADTGGESAAELLPMLDEPDIDSPAYAGLRQGHVVLIDRRFRPQGIAPRASVILGIFLHSNLETAAAASVLAGWMQATAIDTSLRRVVITRSADRGKRPSGLGARFAPSARGRPGTTPAEVAREVNRLAVGLDG